jgi:SAM-dependent methyltransferase
LQKDALTEACGGEASKREVAGRIMSDLYTSIRACRVCGSANLHQVLYLGETPLADHLLTEQSLNEPEPHCPLTVVFCPDCSLMQIIETVDPKVLFGSDYPYYSSVSPMLLDHFRGSVEEILSRRTLGAQSLVVELASNDGYLLRNYVTRGVPVLGIDPATGPAQRAREAGINTLNDFFTIALAEKLAGEGVVADVIHANNVLAHVSDTNGFVAGIARLLKDDGEVVIECPYLRDLIEHCEFDTIYHQHLCYFSIKAIQMLFQRHGLYLNRVLRTSIHGGSLRLFLAKRHAPDPSVAQVLGEERATGMHDVAYYREFAGRVTALRDKLRGILDELHAQGRTVAGYGAAAKGTTMMSFAGIDRSDIGYIVDRSEFKQGRYMPGNHVPIKSVELLASDRPEYVLLLSWNFAEEIIRQQAEYRARGGKFIVPVPEPRIV